MIIPEQLLQKANEIRNIKNILSEGYSELYKHCMELKEFYDSEDINSNIAQLVSYEQIIKGFDSILDSILKNVEEIIKLHNEMDEKLVNETRNNDSFV